MKKLLGLIIAISVLLLVFAGIADAAWQVTGGRCEGHSYNDVWSYGGNIYGCWRYGWEIRTFLWV